jgi:hypothetical protein
MVDASHGERLFSGDFDDVFAVGAEPGNNAYSAATCCEDISTGLVISSSAARSGGDVGATWPPGVPGIGDVARRR